MYIDALAAAGVPPRLVVTGAAARSAALSRACDRFGIPLEHCADVNDPAFVARVSALAPDLLFVAGCSHILGDALLRVPRLGAVNFHPSRLPFDRGREPLFWAILRGQRQAGITAHRMTAAVDAGPILLQRAVAVPERATSASLALLVDHEGASLAVELLVMAQGGGLPEGWLPASPGSHVPPLRAEHGLVDWARSAEDLDRLVRACVGEIPAYTFYAGMKLKLLEAAVHAAAPPASARPDGHSSGSARPERRGSRETREARETGPSEELGRPGTVLGVEGDALVIAAAEGALAVRRWLFMDRGHSGAELFAALDLEVGARLAANPAFSR